MAVGINFHFPPPLSIFWPQSKAGRTLTFQILGFCFVVFFFFFFSSSALSGESSCFDKVAELPRGKRRRKKEEEWKPKSFLICSAPKWILERERYKEDNGRDQGTDKHQVLLRRLRGWLELNQKEQEMSVRVPSTISFTGTARWVPFMTYLVMEPLVTSEVLNSGLKLLTHTTNSFTRPKRPCRSSTAQLFSVCVPLISQRLHQNLVDEGTISLLAPDLKGPTAVTFPSTLSWRLWSRE